MQRILLALSLLVCAPIYSDAKQFEILNKKIQQHNIAGFQAVYKAATLSQAEHTQLLQFATAEEAVLKKAVKKQNKLPSRAQHLGWGTLSLVGSALVLSPIIINGAECAYKKNFTPLHSPEWYDLNLLFAASDLAHTINPNK